MKQAFKKLGLLLTLLTAVLFITGCPGPNKGPKEYTVQIMIFDETADTVVTPVSYTVEAGDTLASISGFTDPTPPEGYIFKGYFKTDGTAFSKTTPIKENLTLFTLFEKVTKSTTTDTTTTTTTTKSTEQVTTTKTEVVTKNADATTTTEVEVEVHNDKTDKPISNEKSTTTTNEQEEVIYSATKKTEYDENGEFESKVETELEVTTDANGNTVTVSSSSTTTLDESGKEISSAETVTTIDNGSGTVEVITETSETAADGSVTSEIQTQIETPQEITVRDLIDRGIEAASAGRIGSAQVLFNQAYEKEPDNDEAKVYSALADLVSIATNSKMQEFFKDHLGVQNYPSNINDLISGNWLMADSYECKKQSYFYGHSLKTVTNPFPQSSYAYKVSLANSSDENAVQRYIFKYYPVTVNGKVWYVDSDDYEMVTSNLEGVTSAVFSGVSRVGWSYSFNENRYVVPDEDGEYWAYLEPEIAGENAIPYEFEGQNVKYEYSVTYLTPKFNRLEDQDWFTTEINSAETLGLLVAANVINGNSNGLNDAIDDLYSALFESDEYKSAIEKINSIKTSVALPALAVQGMGLGESEDTVAVGAAELKLIKTVLDVFKGVFEYLQSYSLDLDLSLLKTDLGMFMTEKPDEQGLNWILDNFGSYNAGIDPLGKGFLCARSGDVAAAKMAQSKATFIGIIDDMLAAYDDITAENSEYPSMITGMLEQYELAYDGAQKLKAAIQNGGLFGVPKDVKGLTAWPVPTAIDDVIGYMFVVDLKNFFTPGYFGIDKMLETTTVNNRKVPVFYNTDTDTAIETKAQMDTFLSEADSTGAGLTIKLLARDVLLGAVQSEELNDMSMMISAVPPIPVYAALIFYNFYYGGYEEEVEGIFTALVNGEMD